MWSWMLVFLRAVVEQLVRHQGEELGMISMRNYLCRPLKEGPFTCIYSHEIVNVTIHAPSRETVDVTKYGPQMLPILVAVLIRAPLIRFESFLQLALESGALFLCSLSEINSAYHDGRILERAHCLCALLCF